MTRRELFKGMSVFAGITASCGEPASSPAQATGSPTANEGTTWVPAPAGGRIYRLEDTNTIQLAQLPRDKTVMIIPGAYKGEHGPYLPNVDSFRNARLARELANAIAGRPGWHVVMFPFIPLGQGAGNDIADTASFSGTFVVRISTLRAIFMDLADHLGEQGFRWVFVMHHHGSPYHLHALDEAGDYFNDNYKGHMVNLAGLRGLEELSAIFDQLTNDAQRAEDASSPHAGMRETSEALYLRPDLVDPAYKQAPALSPRTFDEFIQVARQPGWPGYFGSPRLATASLGEQALKEYSTRLNALALEILDGRDYRRMTRLADEAVKADDPISDSITRHEHAFEQRQAAWLKRHDRPGAHAVR